MKCKLAVAKVALQRSVCHSAEDFEGIVPDASGLSALLEQCVQNLPSTAPPGSAIATEKEEVIVARKWLHDGISHVFITKFHEQLEANVLPALPPDYQVIARSSVHEEMRKCFFQKEPVELVAKVDEYVTMFNSFKDSNLMQLGALLT